MIFLPSMNNLIDNILQLTEHKYNLLYRTQDIKVFVPIWSVFAGPANSN